MTNAEMATQSSKRGRRADRAANRSMPRMTQPEEMKTKTYVRHYDLRDGIPGPHSQKVIHFSGCLTG
jgi:hypothetical protein